MNTYLAAATCQVESLMHMCADGDGARVKGRQSIPAGSSVDVFLANKAGKSD